MRKYVLSLVVLMASAVQAHAAIRVPFEVAIAILAILIAVAAVMWAIVGIIYLARRLSARRQAAAQKAAEIERLRS